ncbi:MAG: type I-B CRISPR-associated protein Cas7/Csh2 [Synergistetes bacterium]|nr:type I-B CRISPR-associated protein Cas7/Csh2 [Synergistota bacterium]
MGILRNRNEILFIYDVRDANPNGDPLDENKPRVDEETGQVIVTDVRLKRTIRDYLYTVKGLEVFIREEKKDDGTLRTKKERMEDFENDPKKVLEKCIDMRLFGATTAVKEARTTWIGPVQFKFGRSLHRISGPVFMKGTTVMPSGEGREQGTFREEWIVPYALIAFYGVANEHAAQDTRLEEKDLDLMIEAMWKGTKDLITRSKFGQEPRFLLRIIYKEDTDFYIGELDKRIKWVPKNGKREEEVRDISEGILEIDELIASIDKHKDKINRVEIALSERLNLSQDIVDELKNALGKESVKVLDLT